MSHVSSLESLYIRYTTDKSLISEDPEKRLSKLGQIFILYLKVEELINVYVLDDINKEEAEIMHITQVSIIPKTDVFVQVPEYIIEPPPQEEEGKDEEYVL